MKGIDKNEIAEQLKEAISNAQMVESFEIEHETIQGACFDGFVNVEYSGWTNVNIRYFTPKKKG
jgi:hypothetical protein